MPRSAACRARMSVDETSIIGSATAWWPARRISGLSCNAAPGRCDDDFYRPENIGASQMESFLYGIQTQAPNGILGDPTGSTAEDGERLLDLAAEALARELAGDRRPVTVAG